MTRPEEPSDVTSGMTVEMLTRADFLEVLVSGTYDLREAVDRFSTVLDAASQAETERVLIDHRKVKAPASAAHQMHYVVGISRLYAAHLAQGGPVLRIAFLSGQEEDVYAAVLGAIKDKPFARFTNRDQALSWLRSRME